MGRAGRDRNGARSIVIEEICFAVGRDISEGVRREKPTSSMPSLDRKLGLRRYSADPLSGRNPCHRQKKR
jgi:hypothetical protein